MKPRTDVEQSEILEIVERVVDALRALGLYGVGCTGSPGDEHQRTIQDVHRCLTGGGFPPHRDTTPLADRARLAVVYGVCVGAPVFHGQPATVKEEPPKPTAGAAGHGGVVPQEAPTCDLAARDAITKINRSMFPKDGDGAEDAKNWLRAVIHYETRPSVRVAAVKRLRHVYGDDVDTTLPGAEKETTTEGSLNSGPDGASDSGD